MSHGRNGGMRVVFIGALLAIGAVLFGSVSASAHGGEYVLTVSPDGLGGVSVIGQYVEDGHQVDAILDPVVTAVASDGRTAGPVELVSSAEGEGIWATPEPFLDDGTWTVTVTTTTPLPVTATVEFEVAPLAPPISGEDAGPVVEDAPSDTFDGWLWVALAFGIAAAIVIGGVVALIRRRNRARASVVASPERAKELVR